MSTGLDPIAAPEDERALRLQQYLADLDTAFPMPEQAPETQFNPSGFQRILEGIAGAQLQPTDPHSLGQGFLSGLVGGLGSAGSRVAKQRDQFEQASAKRRAQSDAERLDVSRTRRQALFSEMNADRDRERATRKENAQLDQTSPVLTPELKAQYPALARLPEGKRVAPAVWTEAQRRELPESPADIRAAAADRRAAAADARAARSEARDVVTATARKPLPVSERAQASDDVNAIQQTGHLKTLFKPEFVGPAAGRMGSLALATGKGVAPGYSMFRAALAKYNNAAFKVLAGTAGSKAEADRVWKQLPTENDPSEVFSEKLAETDRALRSEAATRRSTWAGSGLDIAGLPPIPPMPSEPGSAESRTTAAQSAPPALPVGQYKPGGLFDSNRPKAPR